MTNALPAFETWGFALKSVALLLLLLVMRCGIWLINLLVVAPWLDPLKDLPGPPASFFQNHFVEVLDPDETPDNHRRWSKEYGKTFRFHGFGRHDLRLMSLDFRVVSHVLTSSVYEKPWQTRSMLGKFLGQGVFTAEGTVHKQQRKLIGPAFTSHAIKSLTPFFFQKAEELCERWGKDIDANTASNDSKDTIDALHWFSRATFDAFGSAGFDYNFWALDNEHEPVYAAYRNIFLAATDRSVAHIMFPMLDKIWPDKALRTINSNLKVIHDAGRELVQAKKSLLESGCSNQKDLLSVLIKSNLSSDPSTRLSDSGLIDQLSSFLFAGSDSTAVAIAWCFHFLSLYGDVQTRLRTEIHAACSMREPSDSGFEEETPIDPPSSLYESINSLPFLDSVVRETLRLCPPVHGTIRVATKDDCIPVSHPVTLRNGRTVQKDEHIHIKKGSFVHIPIEGLNYDEDIWGEDSREFNPDRWTSLPDKAQAPAFPGLANLMTFSLGPHSCPASKLTINEMKAFVATLLPHFSFHPVEGQKIGKYNDILMRPFVKGHLDDGVCLPLVVRRYEE